MSSTTAGALRLNGGTFHGAKGTKHAAIAGTGFKHFAAAFAFIEELTRVRRHGLRACEIAFRARENGFELRFAHGLLTFLRFRLRRYKPYAVRPTKKASAGMITTSR